MNDNTLNDLEKHLITTGQTFNYPPTPDIVGLTAGRLQKKNRRTALRLTWGIAILVVLLGILLAVPPVRAQILEFIQIGVIRIFSATPTPTASLPALVEPSLQPSAAIEPPQVTQSSPPTSQPAQGTPMLTATPLPSLLDLAGETTLAEAQAQLTFPIQLPAYPPDLGLPNRVFLQDAQAPMLVLVWLSSDQPGQIALSLHIFGSGSVYASKWAPSNLVETIVNGQAAVWAEGPYLFRLKNGDFAFDRLITGHVLVWTEGDLTYRLESNLTLDEARKIAESLKPIHLQSIQP